MEAQRIIMQTYHTGSLNLASVLLALGYEYAGLESTDRGWFLFTFSDPAGILPEITRLYHRGVLAVPVPGLFDSLHRLRRDLSAALDALEEDAA